MANPMKVVNNVYIEMTDAEVAQGNAAAEAADLDMSGVRSDRNNRLRNSDWTQLGDAALGDHTAEEWATYRQSLRDLPATYSRVSEVVWPNDPPTQGIVDAEAARLAPLGPVGPVTDDTAPPE